MESQLQVNDQRRQSLHEGSAVVKLGTRQCHSACPLVADISGVAFAAGTVPARRHKGDLTCLAWYNIAAAGRQCCFRDAD